MCLYLGQRKFRHNAESRRRKRHMFCDKNWNCRAVCGNRTEGIQVDCRAFGVTIQNTWRRRTRAVNMSHSSEVYMDNGFMVPAIALMHMDFRSDHEGQEQGHYSKRKLDRFLHACALYQKRFNVAGDCGSVKPELPSAAATKISALELASTSASLLLGVLLRIPCA